MTEIVKMGAKPKDIMYEYECTSCECIFRFSKDEAFVWYTPFGTERLTIDCPCCSRGVTINAHRIDRQNGGKQR